MKIKDILTHLDKIAPLSLAMDWDNCGLLIGDKEAEVTKVFITLDVTPRAVELAIALDADLIVSHHPLIFRALKKINDALLLKLIQKEIAVIALHTNLDVAPGGVNHALAAKLGLKVLDHLSPGTGERWHHVSVTVPEEYASSLRAAVFEAGAGLIGAYDSCSTLHPVKGSFYALPGSDPFLKGEGLVEVEEQELEFMVDSGRLNAVLAAITKAHPYQTPAIYHFPVANSNPAFGLGLVCQSETPLNLNELKELCRKGLKNPAPRLWSAGRDIGFCPQRIAICGGSGGSLLQSAAAKADIFISGDFSYHQLLDAAIPVIDAGHFFTEYPVLDILAGHITHFGLPVEVMKMEDHEFYRMHSL